MADFRFALRQLLKSPAFTAIAVLTIALGIGANTAVFSVINTVLLQPLPFPNPDRLVTLFETNPQKGIERQPVSPLRFEDWQRENEAFEQLGFWRTDDASNLATPDGTDKIQSMFVSSSMFSLLGAKPFLGRVTLPDEDRLGGPLAVVLSYELWQGRFSAAPNVIGQTLIIDRHGSGNYTIAGVLPPGFRLSGETDAWLSWSGLAKNRIGASRLNVLGRLKPGVTLEQARAHMNVLQDRLSEKSRDGQRGFDVAVSPLLEELVGQRMKLALYVLWGVVAGVLLIACVNVAHLLLARAAPRQKEVAVRFALGATRWDVLRPLLMESLLLAFFGGVLGILLGMWGVEIFLVASPIAVPRLQDIALDSTMLLFTLFISLLTGLMFGLAPAWQFARTDLNGRLKQTDRSTSVDQTGQRTRNVLVVAEVALSLILLVGAGLMLQSFLRLMQADRGIKPEHLLTANLDFSMSQFTTWTETTDTRPQVRLQEMMERVRQQPGVQLVGATSWLPRRTGGTPREPMVIIGRLAENADGSLFADHAGVTPDYFRTLGVPLLRGRNFSDADQLDAPPVLIINETLAKRYFANEDPIGKRIAFADRSNRLAPAEHYGGKYPEIVGVVADIPTFTQNPELHPCCYAPHWQYPMQNPALAVRVSGDPAQFGPILRREIKAVDPLLPTPRLETMDHLLGQIVAQPRFQAWTVSMFAGIALALAALGLYGVLACAVTQRQREIGVRMALGAQRRDVLKLVVGQGMRLVIIGAGLGLIGSFALTRVLRNLLFEVKPGDPLTLIAVTALLFTVALLACYLPARRAANTDAMTSLRYE